MKDILIKNARLINESKIYESDVLISNGLIDRIDRDISHDHAKVVDANGNHLMPGIIDDQVHFREPGLTHKANIFTESRAALIGGVTSFMEMPNTKPPATTQGALEHKYNIASEASWSNYSFFFGASNDNIEEVLKTPQNKVCGIKVFMGSSTGNMLVDDHQVLEQLFSKCPMLIATHCEKEEMVRARMKQFRDQFGDTVTASQHHEVRDRTACYASSSEAVALAKKYGTRLHILHISSEDEIALFERGDRKKKMITSEACVHHMFFSNQDYDTLGNLIKCNPAIKLKEDRNAIRQAVIDGRIDVIATDHAPHTKAEKDKHYWEAPSGLPLIQHTLHMMLQMVHDDIFTLEQLVDKMCHAPADLFDIDRRGYLREGYHADMLLLDANSGYVVKENPIHYKCNWSPLHDYTLKGKISDVFLNGIHVVHSGDLLTMPQGERLLFNR